MHDAFEHVEECLRVPERRTHSRQPVRTISYVELDEGNGGIVLNASEGGLSVQAVMSLMEDSLPNMRFQLSQSNGWLETSARVAWTNESRKVAGLQFVDLPDETRLHIRQWLAEDASGPEPSPQVQEAEATAVRKRSAAIPITADLPPSESDPLMPAAIPQAHTSRMAAPAPLFGQTPRFVTGLQAVEEMPLEVGPGDRVWNVVGVVALLAILGLTGWLAGRGTLRNIWESFGFTAAPAETIPETVPAPVSTEPVAAISQIESVDVHNQTWTFPFNPDATGYLPSPHAQGPSEARQWPSYNPAVAAPKIKSRAQENGASVPQPSPPAVAQSNVAAVPLPAQVPDPRDLAPPTPKTEPQASPSAGVLQRGVLIYHVDPIYPELARQQGVQGTVKLQVTIGESGAVRSVIVVSGPGLLVEAARNAVRQWRYTPSLLNGKPVESQIYVSILFQLPPSNR